MVDPIVSKIPTKGVNALDDQAPASPAKSGESKFDKVLSRMQDQQAQGVEIPPEVKQISAEQTKLLETDLKNRLQHSGTTSARGVFKADITQAKSRVENLTSRVNALPKTPSFEPLRQRLTAIDNQFQSAGKLVNSLKGNESPSELMKIQVQMYQLGENLELMSKVVEQVSSGVKSVIQTQL